MTKREEVRLACLDRAIAYYKATGMPMMMEAARIAEMAAEFEKFVARPDRPIRKAS